MSDINKLIIPVRYILLMLTYKFRSLVNVFIIFSTWIAFY